MSENGSTGNPRLDKVALWLRQSHSADPIPLELDQEDRPRSQPLSPRSHHSSCRSARQCHGGVHRSRVFYRRTDRGCASDPGLSSRSTGGLANTAHTAPTPPVVQGSGPNAAPPSGKGGANDVCRSGGSTGDNHPNRHGHSQKQSGNPMGLDAIPTGTKHLVFDASGFQSHHRHHIRSAMRNIPMVEKPWRTRAKMGTPPNWADHLDEQQRRLDASNQRQPSPPPPAPVDDPQPGPSGLADGTLVFYPSQGSHQRAISKRLGSGQPAPAAPGNGVPTDAGTEPEPEHTNALVLALSNIIERQFTNTGICTQVMAPPSVQGTTSERIHHLMGNEYEGYCSACLIPAETMCDQCKAHIDQLSWAAGCVYYRFVHDSDEVQQMRRAMRQAKRTPGRAPGTITLVDITPFSYNMYIDNDQDGATALEDDYNRAYNDMVAAMAAQQPAQAAPPGPPSSSGSSTSSSSASSAPWQGPRRDCGCRQNCQCHRYLACSCGFCEIQPPSVAVSTRSQRRRIAQLRADPQAHYPNSDPNSDITTINGDDVARVNQRACPQVRPHDVARLEIARKRLAARQLQAPRYLEPSSYLAQNVQQNTHDGPQLVVTEKQQTIGWSWPRLRSWLLQLRPPMKLNVDSHLYGLMCTEAAFKPRNPKLLLTLMNYGRRVYAEYTKHAITSEMEFKLIASTALAVYQIGPEEQVFREHLAHYKVQQRVQWYNDFLAA